jgi:hypothetical protein
MAHRKGVVSDLPCYQCLCLPACRNKSLNDLDKCQLFVNFIGPYIYIPTGLDAIQVEEYSARYETMIRYIYFRTKEVMEGTVEILSPIMND